MTKQTTRDLINEHGLKIISAIILFIITGYITTLNSRIATAQSEAEASVTKVITIQKDIQNISDNVESIKQSANEMSMAVGTLKELVIRHDKDLEFNRERLKQINERINRLERK